MDVRGLRRRALVIAAALLLFTGMDAAAQAKPAAPAPKSPVTRPDGQPDIEGIWGGSAGGCSIETGICPEFFNGRPGREQAQPKSVITDPKDGKIPYQAWAAARRAETAKHIDSPQSRRGIDSRVLCFNGPPRSMYNYAFKITQTADVIIMQWEWSHLFRVIPLNRGPHVGPGIKLLMGDSRGRWEGRTLVVETTSLNDWSWFDDTGTFRSDTMTLLERFTVVDAGRIDYKATITDPRVFTQPWTMDVPITRRASLSLPMASQGDTRFTIPADDPFAAEPWEHACVEGERAVETMLGKAPK